MPPNPYLLAADSPQQLLALLRQDPSLAAGQDEHGYSLVHAAASYNHVGLLRDLVGEFHVPVDLRDEDGETALFVVETVEAARVLVDELGLDTTIRNGEGQTAREKIEGEGDYLEVAEYLQGLEAGFPAGGDGAASNGVGLPPVPEGLTVRMGTMDDAEEQQQQQQPDPELRRRIEELAAREDFQTAAGQAELRRLVEEAIGGQGFSDERSVRPRQD
ncbi:hypothetical protein BT67DRAFT_441986 [Trichocladium antarcticum]|uniref:Ankyrin repeat protein n=1 Tax=Trichocladium antarcticum TaxID=1450529 RepID=A0AAN6ZDQ9_9PEZI|nr:hypothetical protein BT67DRAFT_441986 [Trichocladium antarcticum]